MDELNIGENIEFVRTTVVTRHAVVETVEQALAFVLTTMEQEGIRVPTIEIYPTGSSAGYIDDDGDLIMMEEALYYDVSVGGTVNEVHG